MAYTALERFKRLIWRTFKKNNVNNPKKRKNRKTENAEKREPHVDSQQIVYGNIAKGSFTYCYSKKEVEIDALYYAFNGWHYLGSNEDPDRDIYNDSFSELQLSKDLKDSDIAAVGNFYNGDNKANFNQSYPCKALDGKEAVQCLVDISGLIINNMSDAKLINALKRQLNIIIERNKMSSAEAKVAQYLPYKWQAHHILPMNCFTEICSEELIKIIRRSNYDINCGSNIIFLPENEDDTYYHTLPKHASDHIDYNEKVIGQLEELNDKIDEIKEDKKPHESIAFAIEKELYELEKVNFRYIVSYIEKKNKRVFK